MTDEFDEYIDWAKVDLLDACYDPAIGGMGLDSRHCCSTTKTHPHQSEFGRTYEVSSSKAAIKQISHSQELITTTIDPPAIINHDNLSHGVDTQPVHPVQYTEGPDVFENRSTAMTRSISPCRECGATFQDPRSAWAEYEKDVHGKAFNHGAYSCQVKNCNQTFIIKAERNAHARTPHMAGHGRMLTNKPNDCIECEQTFRSKANLLLHAKEAQHQPYGCECGVLFSRLDVLNRHLESFAQDDPKYPCKYCKLHRGPHGFRRLDHLKQHIRNYHHLDLDDGEAAPSRLKYAIPVCPHNECAHHRDESFKQLPPKSQAENKPFNSQSAYTKHMRDEHNECTFPCDVPGCARTGRRGYFREKDLLNHRRKEHPLAPEYFVPKRDFRIRCTEPGCGSLLHPTSMTRHALDHQRKLGQAELRRRYIAEQQGTESSEPTIFQNSTSDSMSQQPDFSGF